MHSSLSVAHHRETARLPSCSPQPVPPLLPYLPRAPSQRFSPSIPMLPLAPMPTISHHKAARSYEVRSSTAPSGSLATSSGSKPPHSRATAGSDLRSIEGHTNIYVRLLPPETRDSDLLALGSYWGRVISVRAILSHPPPPYPTRRHCLPSNTTCKGVGFILYENSHQALSAISGLRQIGFEASLARDSLNLRLRQLADEGSTNLYLSNLPTAFGEEDLIHLLRPARVLSVRLLRQNDAIPASQRLSPGPSRGIGFARIADRDAADEVIERLQAVFLPGSNAPLRVRYADSMGQKELKNRICLGQTPRQQNTRSTICSPLATQSSGRACGSPNTSVAIKTSLEAASGSTAGRRCSTLSPIKEYTDQGSIVLEPKVGQSCTSPHAVSDASSPSPSPPSANTSRTTSPSPSLRSEDGVAKVRLPSTRPSVIHSRSAPNTVEMIRRCTEVLAPKCESHPQQPADNDREILGKSTTPPKPINLRRSTSSSALH
ncbi:hypothetical protein, variant [Microbotryum lychnidis-dioicae p1A1 Lamole]|uniref:RRM domain-containing protein n=1 Tax=Microbotryum lychnidis-dioicae (strain p1A1 Lamole / MvSl-1064) TaxID=683840 RepID=U5H7A5_USTV1|nr:hypothetical protein, variant [Microbotryum lychnidis-dioicae p1A1 Lamole]|eukprot:KDE06489.1 hypothetical protein, variant [Microbotryum lychnidis-dioicae p1A1 Lamole]